eukprot:TRINITY_DN113609_c0_g1_i1.p1 TRINITY_DN113609_c0_g1~~TRINITY_DN113609_c0_g1_i1.p1  ORF type:complete len:230 (+),score=19.16 TRINITY_DN113609_c0_g1_i1:100-789(+)
MEDDDDIGHSLLEVVVRKLLRDKNMSSRIIFAGRRLSKDESLKTLFDNAVSNPANVGDLNAHASMTGIYVETPSNFVHLLEGEPKQIGKAMREVASNRQDKMEDLQILSYMDDLPERSFPKWTTLEITTPGNAVASTEDALVQEISSMMGNLMQLGGEIFQKEKLQIETYLAGVKTSRPELLPTIAQVDSFLDCGFCLTLDEWLDVFQCAVDIKLQSEQVWPIPPPLKY